MSWPTSDLPAAPNRFAWRASSAGSGAAPMRSTRAIAIVPGVAVQSLNTSRTSSIAAPGPSAK